MLEIKNYINGELTNPINQKWLDNIDPSTGKVFAKIPDSSEEDVKKAVFAATEAFPTWSMTSIEKRSKILLRIADEIKQNTNKLALAESKDNGKPLSLAKKIDIPRAEENFRFFATSIIHFYSESHSTNQNVINFTLRQPIGIVGCISPWNLPLYLFTWKIAPALATGNCIIAKPSEITPLTAFLFSKICIKSGLPAGVLNIVHGLGQSVGNSITTDKKIKAISFTGGTNTGAIIASKAAPMFKKLSLELGGKNANVIFADCDFEKTLKISIQSSFANQGQICLCGSRILIESSIYNKFRDEFIKKVKNLKVSYPLNPKANLGAIVSKNHMNKILSYIEIAKQLGGKILTGGNQIHLDGEYSNGYYIAPTVIENLDAKCKINQEEIFGPIVTLIPFENEKQAIEIANCTKYGLSCTIWTENISKAHRMAEKIDTGIVWINCWLLRDLRTPFGGKKNSGVGREGGIDALRFFTEVKNVCIQY